MTGSRPDRDAGAAAPGTPPTNAVSPAPPPSSASPPWTVAKLVEATAEWLGKQRLESPRLEAEILLAHVLGCRRIDLYATWTDPVDDRHRATHRELVKRRAGREPTAYLVGHREFHSLRFEVTRDVLIPRPETELLVETGLRLAKQEGMTRFADLGTGSGAIAVTLAKFRPGWHGVAVDLSEPALAVARRNAAAHGVTDRLDFRFGDLFEPLVGLESGDTSARGSAGTSAGAGPAVEPFDLLVSNPPYVRDDEWAGLDPEVRLEPRLALTAGADGLTVIRRILDGASRFLRPGGRLLIEHGATQGPAVESLVRARHDLHFEAAMKDLAGHPRLLVARRAP